jgi:hypothetical protein
MNKSRRDFLGRAIAATTLLGTARIVSAHSTAPHHHEQEANGSEANFWPPVRIHDGWTEKF